MDTIASGLATILVVILLGYVLRRLEIMPGVAWAGLERLAYFVLFPALLVNTLARQNVSGVPWEEILGIVLITSVVAAAVLVAAHLARRTLSNRTFTSVFQGGVRFNSYVALAVCQALFGAEGLIAAAVTVGFLIPTVNLLSVSAFSIWGSRSARGFRPFLRDLLLNPLILACVAGWLLGATGTGLPGIAGDVVELTGRAALPVGLLAVGAALSIESIPGHARAIFSASLVQFLLKPATVLLLIGAFRLSGIPAGVLLLTFVTPAAPSSYVLARQLGGDTDTMASIITLQTMLAFVLMPLAAWLLLPMVF